MDEINAFIDQMVAQANAVLATLPPLEQVATAQELIWPIRQLREVASKFGETVTAMKAKVAESVNKLVDKTKADTKAAVISSGEMLTKEAHTLAVETAKTTAKTEADNAYKEQMATAKKGGEARDQAVADKKIHVAIAAKIGTDIWADEARRTVALAKVTSRLAEVAKTKLTIETHTALVASVVALPFDDAGDATFTQQMAPAIEQAKLAPVTATAAVVPPVVVPNPAIQPPAAGTTTLDPNDKDRFV